MRNCSLQHLLLNSFMAIFKQHHCAAYSCHHNMNKLNARRYTPHLAARYLISIPPHEGRTELKAQDPALRLHVMQAMQPRDAAVLLEVQPRKGCS